METYDILDTSVAIERREGIVTIFTAIEYPPSSRKDFDVLFPQAPDYVKAIEIATRLRDKGTPIGAVDIVIAAMCLNRSAKLVTKDNDFAAVKAAFPELIIDLL